MLRLELNDVALCSHEGRCIDQFWAHHVLAEGDEMTMLKPCSAACSMVLGNSNRKVHHHANVIAEPQHLLHCCSELASSDSNTSTARHGVIKHHPDIDSIPLCFCSQLH